MCFGVLYKHLHITSECGKTDLFVKLQSIFVKSVTVSQTASGKYYVSILFAYENQVQKTEPQKFLGLDFSMHELYVYCAKSHSAHFTLT